MNILSPKNVMSLLICSFSQLSYSDLVALEDSDLKRVDGAGIGIVLEDFVFNAGESVNSGGTFEITGLQTSDDKEVVLGISQFYIAGSGSNRGENVIDNPVNIGRLTNPFNIELRDGNDADIGVTDKAVFEFSAPTILNGSRLSERPDLGIRFDLEVDGARRQSLESHIETLSIDGSYVRLWGGSGSMEGEFALNIYTPNIDFFACDAAGDNCGETVSFQDVIFELELGQGEYQPVTFEVNDDGHFVFEVGSLQGKCSSIDATGGCNSGAGTGFTELSAYYDSGPSSNSYIGNVSVGGESFGSSTIENLQIQYLNVTSHDL
jgi:hypothetical protein